MRLHPILAAAVPLLLALPSMLTAQGSSPLGVGARVRVVSSTGGARTRATPGSLVRLSGDTAVIASASGASETFLLGSGQRLEVRTGSHRRVIRGTLLGLLIGGVTGGVVGALAYRKCEPDPNSFGLDCILDSGRGTDVALGAAIFGLLGTGVGAIIGTASKSETWAPFATTGVRVGLRADLRRAGLGVRLTF